MHGLPRDEIARIGCKDVSRRVGRVGVGVRVRVCVGVCVVECQLKRTKFSDNFYMYTKIAALTETVAKRGSFASFTFMLSRQN